MEEIIISNVLARDRGLSTLAFYTHLQKTITKMEDFLLNPKKFGPLDIETYCSPVIQSIYNAMEHVIIANSIFPTNPHEVMIRRDYQNIAIGLIESTTIRFQRMILGFGMSINEGTKPNEIIKDLELEIKYLKWWRKQNNSLMKKFGDSSSRASKVNTENNGIRAADAKLGIEPPVNPLIKVYSPYGSGKQCKENVVCPIYPLDVYDVEIIPVGQKPKKEDNVSNINVKNNKSDEPVEYTRSSTSSKPKSKKKQEKGRAINFFDKIPIKQPESQ